MHATEAQIETPAPSRLERPANGAMPLAPVLLFAFLNSFGSGVAYNGLFTLAKFNYAFTPTQNFLLALLYGVTYMPAALLIGPFLRRLPEGSRLLNHRGVLVAIMFLMAAVAWMPVVADRLAAGGPGEGGAQTRAQWPIWLAAGLYSPLSGCLWPIVESYVSGGRRGAGLRGAIGKFNVCWSSALVVTLLGIAPFVRDHAIAILTVLGWVQVGTAVVLVWFGPRPGEHLHEHEPHPPVYDRLLRVFQVLLAVAFLGISTLAPYLSAACKRLEIPAAAETPIIAIWMTARVFTFFAMERTHRWHGRWSTPVVGTALLLVASSTVVLAPVLLPRTPALVALVVGLLGFGVAIGMIYAATLYYTMEVGSAEVDAGGVFETLIGLGYTLGPLCGLAGLVAVSLGSPGWVEQPVTVGVLALLSGVGVMVAVRRARGGGAVGG